MRSAPFNLQGKGVLEVQEEEEEAGRVFYWRDCVISNSGSISSTTTTTTTSNTNRKIIKKGEGLEPRSVLDNRRSPSPPTSTSTLSSSLGGGGGSSDTAGVAAVSENTTTNTPTPTTHKWPPFPDDARKDEWASDLQPIPSAALEIPPEKCSAVDDWEAMLSESAASPGQEQTFLRWIMGDLDDPSSLSKTPHPHPLLLSQLPSDFDPTSAAASLPFVDPQAPFSLEAATAASAANPLPPPQPPLFPSPKVPTFSTNSTTSAPFFFPSPVPNPLPMFFQEPIEEKPQSHHLFNPGILLNQSASPQNPSFFLPFQPDPHLILPPNNPKRHLPEPKLPFPQTFPPQLPFRPSKPKDEAAAAQQQQQSLVDHLSKAAELLESGHPTSAREILARLNHHLPSSPIALKPLLRSAFYFKETLHLLLSNPTPTAQLAPASTPWEIVLKLSSYKDFSEVSPLLHFTNFTSTQTLLEELDAADRIHLVDFDIGIGGHWSSFMQELAHRRSPSIPYLKVTAFVNPSSFHPLELHLTRDNLSHFAADLNIPFEFSFQSIESFDPLELLAVSPNETIAVNLPIGSHYSPPFPTLLRLVKQLNPKIVVSVDNGCDRGDLPFSHHFLHAFQSCVSLLDSIDAAGTNSDVAGKIERFIVQPRIENAVFGRHRAVEKMLPWRTLFASTGFVPVQFSNFTETQAECLLKRVQVRGFHVEKRQASLFLYWQRGELGSVSAWRC